MKRSRACAVAIVLCVVALVGCDHATKVRGHVVDFIHVRFWPVFNVADILVVAGGLLLLVVHATLGARRPTRSR